jgi:hypothetical protein
MCFRGVFRIVFQAENMAGTGYPHAPARIGWPIVAPDMWGYYRRKANGDSIGEILT